MNTLKTVCPELAKYMDVFTEVARYLWEKGWAESNGGNLSVDVTDYIKNNALCEETGERVELGRAYPELANRCFLVTGSGHRFRDFARDVSKNACLLTLNDTADAYTIIWGGKSDQVFKPTSELPSHLRLHQMFQEKGDGRRVVLHTHPTELVALSHLPAYKDEKILNNALWGMIPEVKVLIPKGVGFAPYALPGSQDLADGTFKALKTGQTAVLWEMHGCLATGKDVMEAFDIIDILNKSAQMLLMCLQAGHTPKGMSTAQLSELVEAFNLED